MIRRRDIGIIAIVLCIALCLFGANALFTRGKHADGTVEIYAEGKLYATARVGQKETITVSRDGMENVIAFTERGVYMHSSTCKNQLCVGQGEVTLDNYATRSMGTRIICLPNAVEIRLVLSDPDASLPDV